MSISARTDSRRRLRIESLEQKQLLAGDVLVNVVNGALNIQGDDLDNQIAVSSGQEPGTYLIRGLNGTNVIMAGDDTTDDTTGDTTNGAAPERAVVVEGVRRGIRANMGDGDDTVILNDLRVRRSVSINTGAGDDNVLVGVQPPDGPGPMPAATDAVEEDAATDVSVAIRGSLNIRTGLGSDDVAINNTRGGGRLRVAAGADADTVRIGRPEVAADDTGEPGDGEELVTAADDATATPEADVAFRRGVRVHLGAGQDTLAVNDLSTRHLRAHGGEGDDTMRLNGVHSRTIAVYGGRGDGADTVGIRDSATHVLFAALGDGDDTLNLGGVRAQLALLSGGAGDGDTLNELGENRIRYQRAIGFELGSDSEAENENRGEPSLA